MKITYLKAPLHRYTFSITPIRKWVENNCKGKVLNLFAGKIPLACSETRNDIDFTMNAEYPIDALEFVLSCKEKFDTIILDPPYSYRKSMELYHGHKSSRFNEVKNNLSRILNPNGTVITFGYQSISMGKIRGFVQNEVLILYHGGAIHDTIAVKETMK